MTIRGGGHPKHRMVSTPFSRMGPPPRSFAADAHDCIMVRPLWTDRIQGCGAMIRARWQAPPLIVEARLSPSNLSASLRTGSDDGTCSVAMDGWSARSIQQGDRAVSAPCDAHKAHKDGS